MKKLLYGLVIISFITSCNSLGQKENVESDVPIIIGSAKMDGMDVMTPITIGETSNQQTWIEYIKAHNDKNLDKIAKINSENWVGYLPDGSVVEGSKAQREILDNWFKSSNPQWEIQWMIANAAKNIDDEMEQWLTTGNNFTDIDENGNKIFEYNVHDIQFVNGKIKKINVYTRAQGQD